MMAIPRPVANDIQWGIEDHKQAWWRYLAQLRTELRQIKTAQVASVATDGTDGVEPDDVGLPADDLK